MLDVQQHDTRLMAIFQDNLGKPVPENLCSGISMMEVVLTTGAVSCAKHQ